VVAGEQLQQLLLPLLVGGGRFLGPAGPGAGTLANHTVPPGGSVTYPKKARLPETMRQVPGPVTATPGM
jgi:hypothetical protein